MLLDWVCSNCCTVFGNASFVRVIYLAHENYADIVPARRNMQ